MKTTLTALAFAIALVAPTAEARVAKHHGGSHASSTVQAKAATKKVTKGKHKKAKKSKKAA